MSRKIMLEETIVRRHILGRFMEEKKKTNRRESIYWPYQKRGILEALEGWLDCRGRCTRE